MPTTHTRRYVLAARPATTTGPLEDGVLRYEDHAPVPAVQDGQVLVRVAWLSLDVATRGWMNDVRNYLPPAPLGEAMRALGAGVVTQSRHPDFAAGDRVSGLLGWQEHAVVDGSTLRKVPEGVPLQAALHVLGISGQTAWLGLHDIGRPAPGETVVVTAAAGAVGSLAVQLAVAAGARVIGVAGTPEKCALVRELGAVDCVDYREQDVATAIAELAPDRVDVVFDNVGGAMLDALLPHLAVKARVVLCGAVSRYREGGPAPLRNWFHLLPNRVRMEGFIYLDHADRFDEVEADLLPRVRAGELRCQEHVLDGLKAAPDGIRLLLTGTNHGKALVKLG
ncbi:NADP-dependent oxidoreductase [Amycolatopsis rhabdoformis]|uniref:NADP-dependent oxidoreductase n=1 Tax=Amycolatopsis rhabdoformis TaxID=1448059 RepID=A0ABZ1HV74_9PSEU|nr:NADP-dependent oxidoreductase [Amycolatopsis rhabdoformis]WSE26205.1 NADP-dependent oxidoreductase [Amycolatopsis rhabdoformis]